MATLKTNLFLQGASGTLGGQLVYKTKNGKTYVSTRPSKRTFSSEAQQQQNNRFKYAVSYARSVLQDMKLGPIYEAAAAKLGNYRNAYQLALSDYLRSPEIGDLLFPSGSTGARLLVEAYEDPQLAKVTFFIKDALDVVIETGDAVMMANGIQWAYSLKQEVPEGGKVLVRAYDLPGNVASKYFEV